TPPREIWPQATVAADNNDVDTAIKRTNSLIDTGKAYGIKTYPLYAGSAAALSRQAQKAGNKEVASWASKAADQLDPQSPAVSFSNADAAADQKQWGAALPSVLTGFGRVFGSYRTR